MLFLYISRNTYIRKSIGTDSVKKYRIYENNELFPYSHSLRTCDWIGTRDLAQCGCQLYCHYGGVQQIASLSMARRWMPVPGAFYLIPSLILIAGIIALFNPTGARNTAFIIIGISSLVYSLSELINWFKFARRRPKAPVMHDDDDIEDAKIIE